MWICYQSIVQDRTGSKMAASPNLDLKSILSNLCEELGLKIADEPAKNWTIVEVMTRTKIAFVKFRFDNDQIGFQHVTTLGKINEEDTGLYTRLATRRPPREITPVHDNNGVV